MRIKFTGRWNKQSLTKAICEAIEELQFYDIEFLSGVNLYFHGENVNFDKIEIKNENDTPVMFIYDNNIPVIKPRKKERRKEGKHPSLALWILEEIKPTKINNYTIRFYFTLSEYS